MDETNLLCLSFYFLRFHINTNFHKNPQSDDNRSNTSMGHCVQKVNPK